MIFYPAAYEQLQGPVLQDEVRGHSAQLPPHPPLPQALTEGLLLSFDVQMNRASAVRSPVDL